MAQVEKGLVSEEYPYSPVKMDLEGRTLHMLGVVHTMGFWRDHSADLSGALRRADRLIMEADPSRFIKGGYAPDNDGANFYKMVYIDYARHKRPIYFVDSQTEKTSLVDLIVGGAGGITLFEALNSFNYILTTRKHIGRRRFMRLYWAHTAVILGGAFLFSNSNLGVGTKGNSALTTYGPDDLLGLNDIDYRNVRIAKAAKTIARQSPQGEDIMLIYGQAHIDPVRFYLENPRISSAKDYIYQLTYDRVGSRVIREYSDYSTFKTAFKPKEVKY